MSNTGGPALLDPYFHRLSDTWGVSYCFFQVAFNLNKLYISDWKCKKQMIGIKSLKPLRTDLNLYLPAFAQPLQFILRGLLGWAEQPALLTMQYLQPVSFNRHWSERSSPELPPLSRSTSQQLVSFTFDLFPTMLKRASQRLGGKVISSELYSRHSLPRPLFSALFL